MRGCFFPCGGKLPAFVRLTLWKDANPDIPIRKKRKQNTRKLQ
jgi:hypothetical protein